MDLILTEKALCLKEHEYFFSVIGIFLVLLHGGFLLQVMYFHQILASFVFHF